jgi:hypothetical protein
MPIELSANSGQTTAAHHTALRTEFSGLHPTAFAVQLVQQAHSRGAGYASSLGDAAAAAEPPASRLPAGRWSGEVVARRGRVALVAAADGSTPQELWAQLSVEACEDELQRWCELARCACLLRRLKL